MGAPGDKAGRGRRRPVHARGVPGSLGETRMTPLETFWWWINERHAIYLRRQAGQPFPWTTDAILQRYRFCNVFRELDTVTVWLRQNWREPFANHENLWF